MNNVFSVLREFFQLGLTSFGGPSAHIAFFRERFVEKLKWLTDQEFADLLALCQFLPGPASSQFGLAVGWKKAGWTGALAAWIGFTLPSAMVMAGFGVILVSLGGEDVANAGWLRGLQIAVVIVIAKAVWSMAQSLCPDKARQLIALYGMAMMLYLDASWAQILVIAFGAIFGWAFVKLDQTGVDRTPLPVESKKKPYRIVGGVCLGLFAVLLCGLPLLQKAMPDSRPLEAFDAMYRSGALVFGGGHVVLPLLSEEVVDTGWVTTQEFMAGYGAAQAVPGPLFTFSAFLGSVMEAEINPWLMATLCLVGIFLPAWLLVLGVMPFWESLVNRPGLRKALAGTNAVVVGLLGAALYDPVWTGTIRGSADIIFLLGVAAVMLVLKWPAWLVVVLSGVAGWLVY